MDSELFLRQLGAFPLSTIVRLAYAMKSRKTGFDETAIEDLAENTEKSDRAGKMSHLRALRLMQLGVMSARFDMNADIEIPCNAAAYAILGRNIEPQFGSFVQRSIKLSQFRGYAIPPSRLGKRTFSDEISVELQKGSRHADAFEYAWLIEYPELIPVLFPTIIRRSLYVFGGFPIRGSRATPEGHHYYPALLYKGPGLGCLDLIYGWEYTDVGTEDSTEGYDNVNIVTVQ